MESDVGAIVAEMWSPYVDEISTDRIGNLVAIRYGSGQGKRRKVLVAVHMDEIALMVTRVIESNGYGFLQMTNVGGVDVRQLLGQRVQVHGRQNLEGVIGCLPAGMLPKVRRSKAFGYDDLVIDLGRDISQTRSLVQTGDYITFQQPLRKLGSDLVTGKALDNRACITSMTRTLQMLATRKHSWDVIVAATVQEEMMMAGAKTVAYGSQPDIAVVMDVTFGSGPASSGADVYPLGKGPVLDIGINVHPAIFNTLQTTAKSLEMPVHIGPHARSSGTDAIYVQLTRQGIPIGMISLPMRNMHTMVEMVSMADLDRSARLLAEFIGALDDDFLSKLTADMLDDE